MVTTYLETIFQHIWSRLVKTSYMYVKESMQISERVKSTEAKTEYCSPTARHCVKTKEKGFASTVQIILMIC